MYYNGNKPTNQWWHLKRNNGTKAEVNEDTRYKIEENELSKWHLRINTLTTRTIICSLSEFKLYIIVFIILYFELNFVSLSSSFWSIRFNRRFGSLYPYTIYNKNWIIRVRRIFSHLFILYKINKTKNAWGTSREIFDWIF